MGEIWGRYRREAGLLAEERGEHRAVEREADVHGGAVAEEVHDREQLQLLVPDAPIFLDVDDLEDIGALETYIAATQAVLIMLSRGYFNSKNCMREVYACSEAGKPLVLVHETDMAKGGAPLEPAAKRAKVSSAEPAKENMALH